MNEELRVFYDGWVRGLSPVMVDVSLCSATLFIFVLTGHYFWQMSEMWQMYSTSDFILLNVGECWPSDWR